MKKLTTLAMACIFAISCLTSCSRAEDSGDNVTSSTTTTVTTVTTTTTVPDSVPESTTTTTAESIKETTTTTTTTTAPANTITRETTKVEKPTGKRYVLPVKNIQMLPELPSGSELTSAAMVLDYYGFNVTKMDFINYLTIDEAPDTDSKKWSHPDKAFIGHPTKKGEYGCYEGVLEECINNYFTSNGINKYEASFRVGEMSSCLEEVYNGNPVIIWVTSGMKKPTRGKEWMTYGGDLFTWLNGEHCVVLIGYDLDKRTVIVSDPNDPRGIIEYPMETVENVYKEMGERALKIRKKK